MSAETFETSAAGVEQPVLEPVGQVDELVDEQLLAEPTPVNTELLPAGDAGFELDMVGRLSSALICAFLAVMGLLLALWAIPTPVVIAGWVTAVGCGLLAFRQVAGGEAR